MGVQATRDDRSGGGIGKLTCSLGKGTSDKGHSVRHEWRVISRVRSSPSRRGTCGYGEANGPGNA
jgi:hypothetical protein